MAFDKSTRNRLQKFVSNARAILSEEFTRQLQATYGLDPKQGIIASIDSLTHLDNRQRQTAHLLRETLAHYLATTPGKSEKERTKQVLDRIVREQAFTVLNRLAALRMAEARGFLLESIAKAHSSKGFQLYRQLSGTAHGETGDAYRNYLFSLFDEFSLDLAVLFDRHSAQGRLFPRESALLELLAEINHQEIEHLWAEDETVGWIYQFWNGRDEVDQMRSASRAPRTSREMAVRNQFFTPRYVVEFLTDNTLGRIWYEMTQGNTVLADSCRYLVRRPTEIFLKPSETAPELEASESEALSQEELLKQSVYIPHRPLKDPRNIRMLDPACGSMHFGLYAFDLFERIYLEAWQLEQQLGPDVFTREAGQQALISAYESLGAFKLQIPKLIIEHNIHGVDIDPRAVQIAGLSLWQRAQRAWHQQGIKPQQRPTIVKSNIVCAEPMPGEKALLQEFTSKLNPPVLGQLLEVIFDKMKLAGEAGTLLKIEEEIQTAIHEAREQWRKQSGSNSVRDMFQAVKDAATPQARLGFDLSGVDDETFWDDAEQRILQALSDYADQAESNADQKRLFAEDAAKGFGFIDLCKQRFEVILMNPPFGDSSKGTKAYIDEVYARSKTNLLACFIERGYELGTSGAKVGSIVSRTGYYLSTLSEFRDFILENSHVDCHADLGSRVLDATVEVACNVFTKNHIKNTQTPFFRLLTSSNKEHELYSGISCISSGNIGKPVYFLNQRQLSIIDGSPFVYWISEEVAQKISGFDQLKPDKANIRVGLQTGADFRFLRTWWEVPENGIVSPMENTSSGEVRNFCLRKSSSDLSWCFYSKIDKASPFVAPIHLLVNWSFDGREIKAYHEMNGDSPSRYVRSESSYFLPGICYMLRSSRLIPYIVPRGIIPTAGRSQIYPKIGLENDILAIVSSNFASSVARFKGENFGQPKFQNSMVSSIPFTKLSEKNLGFVLNSIQEKFNEYLELYENSEVEIQFKGKLDKITSHSRRLDRISLIGKSSEILLADAYNLTESQLASLELDMMESITSPKWMNESEEEADEIENEDIDRELLFPIISWAVGVALGRFDIKTITGERVVPSVNDPYAPLPSRSPAMLPNSDEPYVKHSGILVSEKGHCLDLPEIVFSILERISEIVVLDVPSRRWFEREYFPKHLKIYSKSRRQAPIYWQLQTPSGSYTLWVYYHRLNEQTLYTCVNDFVEPKLEQVEHDLNGLRSKSARSSQEEKELEKFSDLAGELRDFRDELLRLAKFWKPNLNDGVQITAAPLWKLFQHRAWQNKLKGTWEKLEQGEYDWAHLACSTWPERVLRKCHKDRSLAIAHDVEEHFWHEVEVPVKRGKKLTGATKLEWQPKDLNETALLALIKHHKEDRGL
ncbi:BREX-1 system adenine-specific DNA-methyltransferase PglX [Aliidiomarina sp. Khilg15.8]